MALEGPQLVYARVDDVQAEDTLKKALVLARKLEELLEATRSIAPGDRTTFEDPGAYAPTHSTRMARAMAASLVDELEALVRPARHTGSS